jgi:polysaccharide pyruvyl transferase WcaK-like protein
VAREPEWPAGSPRILVADAWLANAGDGAISLATQERLARIAPGAAILHTAYQGDMLADHYPELALVPPLAGLLGVTPTIPEMIGCDCDAAERLVADADVVLSQGGGFAMEHYDPWERLRAWELVVERGVALGFCAQSVGPFSGLRERRALRRAYEAAAVVGVRESDSAAHVIELGAPPERVLVTADEVFSLPSPRAQPRTGLACVLSSHPQPLRDGLPAAPPQDLDALARVVSGLVRLAQGEHVTLLSTQQGLGRAGRGLEDDAELARSVVGAMPHAEAAQVQVAEGYLPPRRCAREIAGHRGLVSMRMHPAIFGLCAGVPTVLVNQAFKATSMFAMLGLEGVLAGSRDPVAALAEQIEGEPACDLTQARRRASGNDEAVRRLLASVPSAATARRELC